MRSAGNSGPWLWAPLRHGEVYNITTGSLYYDPDGSGTGAAQIVATFQGNPAIAATDITVI
jgi:hypothetical protein